MFFQKNFDLTDVVFFVTTTTLSQQKRQNLDANPDQIRLGFSYKEPFIQGQRL